jgi:hypothetical protein
MAFNELLMWLEAPHSSPWRDLQQHERGAVRNSAHDPTLAHVVSTAITHVNPRSGEAAISARRRPTGRL